jgi:hypothetical protein
VGASVDDVQKMNHSANDEQLNFTWIRQIKLRAVGITGVEDLMNVI